MKNIILLLLTVFSVSTQLKSQTTNTPVITNLTPEEFKEKTEEDKNAVIIDLRTKDEIAKGAIPGAVQIDFLGKDFDKQMSNLDKSKTYYVYCQGGGRSSDAATYMEKQGFKKVYNLEKGFSAWKAKGLPIDKK
jgi:rhodanese-related sulfurtransferase